MFLKKTNQNKLLIRFISIIFISCSFSVGYSQNGVAINTTGASADNSAILDLTNTVNKGLLLPQVANLPTSAASPATALVVYKTGVGSGIYCNIGTPASPNWIQLSSASGNGNYIINSTSLQSPGDFNIAGSGTITGTFTSSNGTINLNVGSANNTNIGGSGNSVISIGGTGNSVTNITSGTGSNGAININGGNSSPVNINTSSGGTVTIGSSGNNISIPKFSTANTVLFTAAGGTLSGTIGSNDKFLVQRSGVLSFNTILASDLPSLAGNYIQNQFGSAQAGAGFWTAGQGRIDGLLTSNAGITNTGALTSSVGAINLNSTIANNSQATNINAGTGNTGPVSIGTGTGTVTVGGAGPQTISIGTAFSTGPSNTINIGSNGDGSNTTTNIIGSLGVNINTISNRTTTIGSSASPVILIGAAATGGTVSLGSTATTTSLNGSTTAINGNAVNINIGNNKTTNINTLATSGAVNIGATAAATQAINIGTGVTGTSTIILGNSSSDAVTTNILGGVPSGPVPTAGVNINTNTGKGSVTNINTGNTGGAVNIGSTTANVNLTKFTTNGTIFYTSGGIGTITGLAPPSLTNQVLVSSGGAPSWSSIPSGSSDYIQNQSTLAQSAKYWINGPANIGGATYNSANQLEVATSGANSNAIVATNTAASGGGAGDGIDGFTAQSTGQGIYGFNTNANGTGIVGAGNNVASGGNYLVAGSGGAFTGNTTGIYAKYTSTTNGSSALYTIDNVGNIVQVNAYNSGMQYKIIGTGSVSTTAENIDNTSKVVLHAPEAPEILFEDYGQGTLINGKVHINIDPVFSKNVAINDKHPLRVFIQLEGDCNGVYVTDKSKTGFDVVELQKGNSNVSFQWHIVCNRANEDLGNGKISHNEDARFEPAPKEMQTLNSKSLQKFRKN